AHRTPGDAPVHRTQRNPEGRARSMPAECCGQSTGMTTKPIALDPPTLGVGTKSTGYRGPDALRGRLGNLAGLAPARLVDRLGGVAAAQAIPGELLGEVLGVHVGVLGRGRQLAALAIEDARDVGALELLDHPGLGLAEGQPDVHA